MKKYLEKLGKFESEKVGTMAQDIIWKGKSEASHV